MGPPATGGRTVSVHRYADVDGEMVYHLDAYGECVCECRDCRDGAGMCVCPACVECNGDDATEDTSGA